MFTHVSAMRHNVIPLMSIYGVLGYKMLSARGNSDPRGTNTKQFVRFVRRVITSASLPTAAQRRRNRQGVESSSPENNLVDRAQWRPRLRVRPPYCPWDNPVECLHGWMKGWLKRRQRCVERDGIFLAVQMVMQSLPPQYAFNAIKHRGY